MVMMKGQVSLPDNNGEFPCICHVESGGEDPGGLLALGHELPLQLQDGVERVRVLVRQPDLPPVIVTWLYLRVGPQVEEMTGLAQLELVHDRALGRVHPEERLPFQTRTPVVVE